MAARRVLVDVNVALDWLLDRKPWVDEGKPLWDSQDAGATELCIGASVLDTMYYIIRKGKDHDTARRAIQQCVDVLTILPVDLAVIQQALLLPGNDFEDNVLIACASLRGLDLIATRDPKGFQHSLVTAIDPKDIAAYLSPGP
jgi:predicted nucleic acid-binding protein